jgi:hypothetical protein
MVLAALVTPSLPWARQWTFVLNAGTQRFLRWGSCCSFLYCVIVTKAVFFDVNDGPNPLQLGCHFEGFESHDVMHSLDGNVTRQVSVDKTIDCRGGVEDLVAGCS